MRALSYILCLFLTMAHAQQLNDFVALKSKGDIPADFTTLSTRKYQEAQSQNSDKELDKDFFLSTRFFFDELLLSGRVLFNDPVTDYLNRVAAQVLRGNSELKKDLRFYILKTTVHNAFSTDQGVILFTTGLLAQLENEAQLAYILCHEISHYVKKHVRNGYIEEKNIIKGKGQYGRLSYQSKIAQMSVYSKDVELEADQGGIEMYLKTKYAKDEIFASFEALFYSNLPFDDIQFDSNYFNTAILKIPGSFYPDTINEISQEEDYDDEGHTHPNIQKRLDAAMDYIGSKESLGGEKYLVSEEDFKKARNFCRFENVNINLYEREYGIALYSIYLLRKDFPDSRFLDLANLKAWYGLVKYKNNNRYNEVTLKTTKVEGESYILHCFLKNLSKAQLNVVGFRIAYETWLKYPSDKVIAEYFVDLKKELAVNSGIKFDDFSNVSLEEYLSTSAEKVDSFDINDSIQKIDASDLSKYEKIRLKKELKAIGNASTGVYGDKDFHLYALYDLVKEKNLIDELKKIKRDVEDAEAAEKLEIADQNKPTLFKRSMHLGIDKLVVVDPIYENYKLNEKRNHIKSENKKIGISDMYDQKYSNLDLKTQLVDSKNLQKSDVDEYNDLGLLMQWISEIVAHDNIEMISSNHDQILDLTQKYGTSHFLFSGIYGYKERSQMSAAHWYGIMMFYTIPIVLVDLLIVHNYFQYIALSVDATTDKVEFTQVSNVNLKSIDGIMRAYIYDVLYQLSSEPKNN